MATSMLTPGDGLKPFAITFDDGYFAVWQCWGRQHCSERIGKAYPVLAATGKPLRKAVEIREVD